jgi:hypothetical protein
VLKNVLKLVFLSIVGFGVLVYVTADKPKEPVVVNEENGLTKVSLPQSFELVGVEQRISKEELFKGESLIVVGNHDSLAVVKEFNSYFELPMNFVMVANISSAPWFVKKMFIPGKLEELNVNSNTPMVYDFEGDMVHALAVENNAKTAFIAYHLKPNGVIEKIYEGNVKEGALDGSMSEVEKKEALKPLFELLNK